jgi:arginine deiminase
LSTTVELAALPEFAPAPSCWVGSEVGQLRRVIAHRPGLELRRLTPVNRAELLFDDVVWVERAVEEHDAFADVLRARSVEVLYLDDLLAQTLAADGVRIQVIRATVRSLAPGARLGPELERWLSDLSPTELVQRLIGGVTFDELPFRSGSLLALCSDPEAFAIAPLPNHLFTRDSSAWRSTG